MSKQYYFSFIDDVIWVFRDLTRQRPASLFDHPFFKILKNAHERYDLKTQLNLFYRTDYFYGMDDFSLRDMTDAYKEEFTAASDWLKLSFHSLQEFPDYPHVNVTYDDMYTLFNSIKQEIFRFAGPKSFGYGIVPHWLPVSFDGCRALYDCGAKLVGVTVGKTKEYTGDASILPYGHAARLLQNRKPESKLFTRDTKDVAIESSICSYNHFENPELEQNDKVLDYYKDEKTGLNFKKLDDNFDLNLFTNEELKAELARRKNDTLICIGNHEQYFFPDYFAYQPEYEQKIYTMAKTMQEAGRTCIFIEEILDLA
ncbi:MAG: hypothetical protein E7418_04030 [Ruminococcaceae bacterium]|nr:hypothetical protein [Oscillospiraceae bacterium]